MTGAMRKAGLILLVFAVLACRGERGRLHSFRAEVKQVPSPGNGELFLHHEAIDDTYRDLSVYGVIGTLMRAGKWGR